MSTPAQENDVVSPVQPSTSGGFRYSAATSLILALVATILTWINTYAIPITARNAAAAGDYGNIYTFAFVSIGVIVLLNVLALGLGIFAARKHSGPLMAGGGIALSATGLLGVALTIFMALAFPQIVVL